MKQVQTVQLKLSFPIFLRIESCSILYSLAFERFFLVRRVFADDVSLQDLLAAEAFAAHITDFGPFMHQFNMIA